MTAMEANFDGLIGPTHNYAGLSYGNIASASNALQASSPREAARQGLRKMKHLADLGLVQGVLPPHQRPYLPTLRAMGFTGTRRQVLGSAWQNAPDLVRNCYAASAMWTANAATVSPSADTEDGRVHFTPANLAAMFHRSIEHETTGAMLKRIFADDRFFAHHPAIAGSVHIGDEGAANHNRLCTDYGNAGIEIFVYGKRAFEKGAGPKKFPARQSFEASTAIARFHGLDAAKTIFTRQHPDAIDGGAFHNDVVAVANRNVLFFHELAFDNLDGLKAELAEKAPELDIHFVEVPAGDVPLGDAVKSYLFNSQLLSVPGRDGSRDGDGRRAARREIPAGTASGCCRGTATLDARDCGVRVLRGRPGRGGDAREPLHALSRHQRRA